ncbi:MAG: hypothetical protein RL437_621 [Actinomycetota bacterium]
MQEESLGTGTCLYIPDESALLIERVVQTPLMIYW